MPHERINLSTKTESSSDRTFGLVFSFVFAAVSLLPVLKGVSINLWTLITSFVLLGVSLVRPQLLTAPNAIWTAFGAILHKITSQIILAIFFFTVVTPIGLVMRFFQQSPLDVRKKAHTRSYWIDCPKDASRPDRMSKQF